jgi:tRNA threonylcarbamoyladenosine biosynthesis protein TsaB
MVYLLLNTCGDPGVAALADEGGVLREEALPGRGTSEHLMPAVRKLLTLARLTVAELAGVGIVTGPGSFTGVRVGLAAAKGLCDAVGLGMVGMSRLALVAASAPPGVQPGGRVVAVLDGGRGEFYCGLYVDGEMIAEKLLTESRTREWMAHSEAITCEARVAERLEIRLVPEPGAEALREMILARVAAAAWSDVATIDGNYLRRTDAELLAGTK